MSEPYIEVDEQLWRRMWWPWPQLVDFLKSLRFWRYRALYLATFPEHEHLTAQRNAARAYAVRVTEELMRMRDVLAPYGETILRGQSEEADPAEIHPPHRPMLLPALEYEMAKAFMNSGARLTGPAADLFMGDIEHYNWRGRPVRLAENL